MKQINYVGTRWHKCDLHLHTPASKCFKDRDIVTPEQWVQAAIDKGLSCVAVTDHNTGEWIDKIKEAAKDTNLTVFPGVEITCSDAKVHLLVLFDVDKGTKDVEDFLISCEIKREMFGKQEAHSPKSSKQILAMGSSFYDNDTVIIPAHIDEFNGICEIKHEPRLALLKRKEIRSVQVVHKDFTLSDGEYNKLNKDELISKLNTYYNRTEKEIQKGRGITMERVRSYRQAVKQSQDLNCAILTFSDNPHQANDSQHGLWGIGSRFTWIKMDKEPTLDCLNQALLVPNERILNDYNSDAEIEPYSTPDTWIESIKFGNTVVTDLERHVDVQFSPQMTSIVGGRGSGKSSVLGFLRGLFPNYVEQLHALPSIQEEFVNFFCTPNKKGKGVLNKATEIEVIIYRKNTKYKIEYKENNSGVSKVYKFNKRSNEWNEETDENFINLFELDIFSQKQIFEIANRPNALRNQIDSDIDGITDLKQQLKELRTNFLAHCAHIRELEEKISKKVILEMEINDIESRLAALDIDALKTQMKNRQEFSNQEASINSFKWDLKQQFSDLKNNLEDFQFPEQIPSFLSNSIYKEELDKPLIKLQEQFKKLQLEFNALLKEGTKSIDDFFTELQTTQWQKDKDASELDYREQREQLSSEGFKDLSDPKEIELEMGDAQQKKQEIYEIEQLEKELEAALIEKQEKQEYFFQIRNKLTKERKDFLDNLLTTGNVKALVEECGDIDNLEEKLRSIFNAQGTYKSDFEALRMMWRLGKTALVNNHSFMKLFNEIKDKGVKGEFSGFFINKVNGLPDAQFDDLHLLVPEDKIIVQYKANKKSKFRSIATASPGQKTAAILTFLLSHGERPLIIDQPEDDLDTSLIHSLVVSQLRNSKVKRQVIVVTHNPNIPVNGDSEYVVIMNSESKYIEKRHEGSIDDEKIRELICDVMEGGVEAFNLRAQRYKLS